MIAVPIALVPIKPSLYRKPGARAAGEDRAWLRRRSGCYTLDADLEAVDLYRFRELHKQARAAVERGDFERAAALLHEAEKLWRGTPLTGLSGMWAERVRARLEEERLDAIRDRIKAELRLGRHAALVGEISDLVVQHPLDQALVEQLMIVLYRCGRQAEALETYRRAHHRLVNEVGSEPGSALRTLHQRMLNGDPELDEPQARAVRRGGQPNSLPRDNPHFTGRTAELDQLFGMIDAESGRGAMTVVAINGMAGVGKSTLAIRAAHLLGDRYQDRFYLHLHTHDPIEEPVDPAAGLGTLLRTLGIPPKGIPGTLEESSATGPPGRPRSPRRRTIPALASWPASWLAPWTRRAPRTPSSAGRSARYGARSARRRPPATMAWSTSSRGARTRSSSCATSTATCTSARAARLRWLSWRGLQGWSATAPDIA